MAPARCMAISLVLSPLRYFSIAKACNLSSTKLTFYLHPYIASTLRGGTVQYDGHIFCPALVDRPEPIESFVATCDDLVHSITVMNLDLLCTGFWPIIGLCYRDVNCMDVQSTWWPCLDETWTVVVAALYGRWVPLIWQIQVFPTLLMVHTEFSDIILYFGEKKLKKICYQV